MSDQQKIQAIYMDLKDSTFGSYTKIKEELDLLGMTTSEEEIEVLHSIVINSKSLKGAVDLSNKLSESEKLKLRNEIKSNYKKEEEEKKKALERKKNEEAKKAEQKDKADMKKAIKASLNRGSNKITDYTVLREKSMGHLISQVKVHMKKGWVPFGGVSAAAFGIAPVGGNSYIQALVKYKQ